MAIVKCTNCGKQLKISDPNRLGTKGRCPECKQVFILTAQGEDQPKQPAVNAALQSKGPGKRSVAPTSSEPHLRTPPEMPPKAARATTSRSAPRSARSKATNQGQSKVLRGGLVILAVSVVASGAYWMLVVRNGATDQTTASSTASSESAVSAPPRIATPDASPIGWVQVKSADGNFQVQMPTTPTTSSATVKNGDLSFPFTLLEANERDGLFYNFAVLELPPTDPRLADRRKALADMGLSYARLKSFPSGLKQRESEAQPILWYEQVYRYLGGINASGQSHPSGMNVYRAYLRGTTMYQFFVDIQDTDQRPPDAEIQRRITQFFSSIQSPDGSVKSTDFPDVFQERPVVESSDRPLPPVQKVDANASAKALQDASVERMSRIRVARLGQEADDAGKALDLVIAQANAQSAGRKLPAESAEVSGLSWRVYLLPKLGYQELYDQFHLSEPWDSPHNKTLISSMPAEYQCPGLDLEAGKTVYLQPDGPGTITDFKRQKLAIHQQNSRAISLVEANADRAVIWTQPADLPYSPSQPLEGLGAVREGGFLVDGGKLIPLDTDLEKLKLDFQAVIPKK